MAYSHQNFDSGKFSYRQIELVVNKMLARGDGKVLVLLPYSYAQKVVPNNSKQRGRRNLSYLSATELVCNFDDYFLQYSFYAFSRMEHWVAVIISDFIPSLMFTMFQSPLRL